MTGPRPSGYRFGEFRIDPGSRALIGADGAAIALTGRAFDVLLYLVERAPSMVGKDELLEQVWAGRVVNENNLTQAISTLRKALGAGAGDHRYILTEARRGYRFVAELQDEYMPPVADRPQPQSPASHAPSASSVSSRVAMLIGAGVLVGVLAIVAATRDRADSTQADRSAAEAGASAADAAAADTTPALAVLRFRTLAGSPRDEMLELGLADTLITQLSRTNALRVRSLASSQRFSGAPQDALEAGRRLGAGYVVDGSAQRLGEQVRVNARLLDVSNGRALWAGTFDARPHEIFTLQDRIAAAVVSALALKADVRPARVRSPCDGADPEAYRAYLTGLHLISRPDPAGLSNALAAFRRAIDLDPACTRAHAGMALAYHGQVIAGDRDPREMSPLASAAAQQALRIDPESADAHAANGLIQFFYEWDWAGAETSLKRAIELNPSLARAHFGYAHLLVNLGRFGQALPHARQARELDPLSPLINTIEAGFLGAAGQHDQARSQLERALELQPEFWIALMVRGGMALDRGDTRAAITDLGRAVEHSKGNSQAVAMLGVAHAAAGDRASAETALRTLQSRDAAPFVSATSLAAVHNALGDTGRALDLLERAYAERDVRLVFLKIDARWNNLRAQPRFRALARKLDLESARAYGRF
ncbi:winged helix-turn-helix domain-containing protein [Luteimonas sp. MC1895]|uniref:winged helix-turn-helix domain-containing tetratricopeptide repeat protein n=1 Tax=Luteimonas sp. MC1895 TaxID=2819513 RepID=UPI0018F06775|nr:winged helix-turn-helix domain-containing protein [Luteimonas sp. MC1895]MBJ6980042.1 winged helix-turn-helix domain-containing protein [Luteimonas sp. MC1895]